MSHNMVNFSLLVAEMVSLVWGTPANFNGFLHIGFVTAATLLSGSQPTYFAQCLALAWAGIIYIHFQRLLLRYGILPRAKFTLRPSSLVLSYWQHYCTESSSGCEPNFAALSTGRHLYTAGRPLRLAHVLFFLLL